MSAPGVPLPLPTLPSLPPRHHDHPSNSQGALALLAIIGLCLAIAAAVLSVIIHSVHMPRLRRRERAAYQLAPESMLGVAEQMTAAVESGMGELDAERPVRDSIIACWQRLRVSAADAGIAPVPSDTPEQAINRVLAASGARAEPLAALAELYREARFSRHAMDGAAVTAARDALGAILARSPAGRRCLTMGARPGSELIDLARFGGAGLVAGVAAWAVIAHSGTSSVRPWLVVSLCVVGALVVGTLATLWRVYQPPSAPAKAAEPRMRTDRETGGLQRVERAIDNGLTDVNRFNDRVRPWLVRLAEHRLRRNHSIDPRFHPEAARTLLGDSLWQIMRAPMTTPPTRQQLAEWLTRIEAL